MDNSLRVGETYTSKQGERYTIIAYRSNRDCDVRFEDGTIVTGRSYFHCKNSSVLNPNNPGKYSTSKIGQTKTMKNGLKATVLEVIGRRLKIRFEDGYERECDFTKFYTGEVKHPNYNPNTLTERVGERVYQENEQQFAEIIEYNNFNDILIRFDDGRELKLSSYVNFKKGKIDTRKRDVHNYKVGDKFVSNKGHNFEIINYVNTNKILVKFDNGYETWATSNSIRYGKINHFKKLDKNNSVGREFVSKCGLKFIVIKYVDNKHITIQFEDGNTKVINSYNIYNNTVSHPVFKTNKEFNYKGYNVKYLFKSYFNVSGLGLMDIHEVLAL